MIPGGPLSLSAIVQPTLGKGIGSGGHRNPPVIFILIARFGEAPKGIVSEYYQIKREDLVHSQRDYFNEARNIAMYLSRWVRGGRPKEIGKDFGLGKYGSVSSVAERMKVLIDKDKILRDRAGHLISLIIKSQEQI